MALGDPYASLAEFRDWLNIAAGSHTSDDQRRLNALNSVTRAIERICGRQFNNTEGVASARVYKPEDLRHCKVDEFYTLEGVTLATDPGGTGDFTQLWDLTQDVELLPFNGVVGGQEGWPFRKLRACKGLYFPKYVGTPYRREAVVQLSAPWGWAQVPSDVKEATLIVSAETLKLKDAPFGVAGTTQFGTVIRVRQNGVAMGMLAPYIREPINGG